VIPDATIEEIRARADIVEVVGEQVQLKRAGKDFKALCPFHNEKTPSFYVVPAKGIYKCFGCGESGDVFTFLMKRNGLDFLDAARHLAGKVGIELPERSDPRPHDDPNRALYEATAFAADHFRHNLWEAAASEAARRYLERRGIARATAERFELGYALDDFQGLRAAAHRHGIADEVLLAAGLIKESEQSEREPYDRLRDRLVFPIADIGGRTIAFGGRILRARENTPKYLNSPETPIHHKGGILYGLSWSKAPIRREGAVLVVEGYMDYVALAAAGIENVVAGMGTALTAEQANLIARYTARAYLLYDSDFAGQRATFRTADALLRAGVHPLVVELPEGEDPDSLVRKEGGEALRPLLEAAPDVLERKIALLEGRGYFGDIDRSRRALDHLLPTLRAVIDPALRDIYIARVEAKTGVKRDTLEAEVAADVPTYGSAVAARSARQRWRAGGRTDTGDRAAPASAARWPAQEALLLVLMLRDERWKAEGAALVRSVEFRDEVNRAIFSAIASEAEAPPGEALPVVLTREADERLAIFRGDRTEQMNAERSFQDALKDLKVPWLFERLEQLTRELLTAEPEERISVLRARMEVWKELQELEDPAFMFKASHRYRELLRHSGRRGTPTNGE
jgi:DNA primase